MPPGKIPRHYNAMNKWSEHHSSHVSDREQESNNSHRGTLLSSDQHDSGTRHPLEAWNQSLNVMCQCPIWKQSIPDIGNTIKESISESNPLLTVLITAPCDSNSSSTRQQRGYDWSFQASWSWNCLILIHQDWTCPWLILKCFTIHPKGLDQSPVKLLECVPKCFQNYTSNPVTLNYYF